MRQDELGRILRESKGERDVTVFLNKHADILWWSICPTGGHCAYVLKEFQLGNRYRADYVLAYAYSGCWEIHFVEIEPPDDHVINKDGTPSRRLSKAITQIGEWIDFIEINPVSVRQDLAKACMTKDILKWSIAGRRPRNSTSDDLGDPETFIYFNYHIVIGNRWNVSKEKRRRMHQQTRHHLIRVFTFGRFLDVARNLDKADNMKPGESVCLTDTDEED